MAALLEYSINGWEGASRGFMWGTGIGAVVGAVAGGLSYLRDSTVLYRAVGAGEADSIKNTGEFSLRPGGFESKQFGTSLNEVKTFGNIYPNDYSQIVKIRVHNSIASQFHFNPNCDVGILNKVYTVGYDQMGLLNDSYFWMRFFGL